jgi:hypothetical protein
VGICVPIQHEIINKKINPLFLVPEDKLINFSLLKSKARPLGDYLKPIPGNQQRKDLDPHWDAVF